MLGGVKDQFSGGRVVVENALGFWVHRVYQASRNEMYRAFREVGSDVTPEQWAVLIRLWERDGRSQSDLSDATFRDRPTMSRILDVLEKGGLVERRTDPDDARARIIHLTRRGRDLEKKLVPLVEEIVRDMTRGIAHEDLVTTRATLKRMFDNLAG